MGKRGEEKREETKARGDRREEETLSCKANYFGGLGKVRNKKWARDERPDEIVEQTRPIAMGNEA